MDMKSGAYANGVPGDGNISSKSDVGTYTYGGNGAGPHAVTSIQSCAGCNVNGQTNPTFSGACPPDAPCADRGNADGNMTADAGRTAQYTSFDIASSVGQGNNVTSFTFTPEHTRGSRTFNGNTMYYLDNPAAGVSEELWTGATSQWDTYLTPYGHIAAELFTIGTTTTPYYFVGDHLESVTALSDASGNQKEYHSFDAWGNGRAKNGNDQASCPGLHPPSLTLRGYTSQETIASYCIIDLNARNYDPAIGRMMGGDPVVGYPRYGQNFNRYSYALNNPLTFADPSGEMVCDSEGDAHADLDCQIDPNTGSAFSSAGDTEGPSCLTCISPRYLNDVGLFLLPFGGLGGENGGSSGVGAAQNIGSINGVQMTTAALGSPLETIIVCWDCFPNDSGDFFNGSFSWDQPWANQGFLGWNDFAPEHESALGHGGEGILVNIGILIATFGMSAPEQLAAKEATDAAAQWAEAAAEAQAAGVPYTSVVKTTAAGAADNITNFDVDISASEAEDNLLANGWQVSGTTNSGNVLTNGTNYYSFYTRSSTGATGMQFSQPGLDSLMKFNFFGN